MAKRCYYEISLDRTHRERRRHQGRLPQAGDGSAIRIAIPATRTPSTASRKSTRPTRSSRTPTSARPMTASATPPSSRAWAAARPGFGADFATTFSDHVRRHLSAWAARRGRGYRPRARRRSALQHGDLAAGGLRRQECASPHSDLGHLRGLLRLRRQGRHQAEDLPDVRRPGQGAPRPGLLHARAHLPELPGPRPVDRQSRARHAPAPAASRASGRCR